MVLSHHNDGVRKRPSISQSRGYVSRLTLEGPQTACIKSGMSLEVHAQHFLCTAGVLLTYAAPPSSCSVSAKPGNEVAKLL